MPATSQYNIKDFLKNSKIEDNKKAILLVGSKGVMDNRQINNGFRTIVAILAATNSHVNVSIIPDGNNLFRIEFDWEILCTNAKNVFRHGWGHHLSALVKLCESFEKRIFVSLDKEYVLDKEGNILD